MKDEIKRMLRNIQFDYGVEILHACESGSRVWGFASENSDYDVRFLYVRTEDWYMSINVEKQGDVIERTLRHNTIDAVGWDVRKALGLMRKSNPALFEWIHSPQVYKSTMWYLSLKSASRAYYNPVASFYHYRSMAENNYRRYIKGKEEVKRKKYLYVVRPLLVVRRVLEGQGPGVFNINELIKEAEIDDAVGRQMKNLVLAKREGDELGEGAAVPILNEWIEYTLEETEDAAIDPTPLPNMEHTNQLFRSAVRCRHSPLSVPEKS